MTSKVHEDGQWFSIGVIESHHSQLRISGGRLAFSVAIPVVRNLRSGDSHSSRPEVRSGRDDGIGQHIRQSFQISDGVIESTFAEAVSIRKFQNRAVVG